MTGILNAIIAVMCIFACYFSWRIYNLTKAKSLLIIMVAIIWSTILRALVVFIHLDSTPWQIGFWAMMVIGLYSLLKVLRKYIK